MRKVVLMFFLSMVLAASGQTVHRVNEIKSVAYGALRLIEDGGQYVMLVRTDNKYHPSVSVVLGDSTEAVRLLTFMSDLKLRDDDIVELGNTSENYIYKGAFGGFRIYERTKTIDGYAHPANIRKLLKALTGGQDQSDEPAKGKKKKKNVPAYMRNMDKD